MLRIGNQRPVCIYSHKYNTKSQNEYKLTDNIYSQYGTKPINNKIIFLNGFITNIGDIRNDFQLNSVKSEEIILDLYDIVGKQIPDYLEGIYSIIIVVENNIIFFRDRNSIENLYYYVNPKDNSFIVSTHIKELKKFITLRINTEVLPKYFLLSNIELGETFFENIKSPKRCEIITINAATKNWNSEEYDDYSYLPQDEGKKHKTIENQVEKIIRSYCKNIQISFPNCEMVNSFSGGVDSSYIQVVLKSNGFNEAYTASYPYPQGASVRRYATEIADYLGADHKIVNLLPSDIKSIIEEGIAYTELPYMFEGECLQKHMFEQITQDHLNSQIFVFDGNGNDTSFAVGRGLIELKYLSLFNLWKYLELPLKLIKKIDIDNYKRYSAIINSIRLQKIDGNFMVNLFSKRPIYDKIIEAFNIKNLDSYFKYEIDNFAAYDVDFCEKFYRLKLFGFELNRENKTSYLNGKKSSLAIIFPYQNDEFIKYMINVPLKTKQKRMTSKHQMKAILKRYIPKQLVDRKKIGQTDSESFMEMIFSSEEKVNKFISELERAGYEKYFNFDYYEIMKNKKYETIALKLLNFHILHQTFITES